jgi:guanylate kinase
MAGTRGRGNLIVVAGPSGSGKTSLVSLALERLPSVAFSVSWTSRPPRDGEQDGRDYRFVSREQFLEAVDRGRFLEHATVHGNLYGTSREEVDRLLQDGVDVLLDIDVQGAEQVRLNLNREGDPGAITIFVAPPDLEELGRRLRHRETDSEDTIRTRLENSLAEISRAGEFDHILINEDLEICYQQFACIVSAARSASRRMTGEIGELFPGR